MMALTYEYKLFASTAETWNQSGFRNTGRRVIRTADFLFHEKDSLDATVNPDALAESEIYKLLSADVMFGEIGRSFYFASNEGISPVSPLQLRFSPWLLLQSAEWVRDTHNRYLFHGRYEYGTPGDLPLNEQTDIEPYALETIPTAIENYPWLRKRLWQADDRIIWEETKSSGKVELKLPTGNFFPEPFRARIPKRMYVQFQFEPTGADIETLIDDRLFSINLGTFEGNTPDNTEAANGGWTTPPRWMISDIQYQQVNLATETTPGAGISFAPGYLFVYTLDYAVPFPAASPNDAGWLDRRALVDRYFLRTPNDYDSKEPYHDPADRTSFIDCLLDKDGTLLGDQNGAPKYTDFVTQPQLSWAFLKQSP